MRDMAKKPEIAAYREQFDQLTTVRSTLLEQARIVRGLSAQRREIIQGLIDVGFSQADIGRELGVTRQAIQKMMATG
jgi:hypothetical protein